MSRLQASALGGLFIGVLSGLPFVGWANVCCCLWVVTGGVLTVYLQQQGRAEAVIAGDGAITGLFAGVIGAVIHLLFMVAFIAMGGDAMQLQMQEALDQSPQLAPEVRQAMERLMAGPAVALVVALVIVPVYAIVGLLGGLLGTLFFRRPPAPEPPPVQG